MLYPQTNHKRSVINLNGIWHFKCVETDYQPIYPLDDYRLMSVPSSYNEISTERSLHDYVGVVCYEKTVDLPEYLVHEAIHLRIGSASHFAKVYINGTLLATHEGGFLPIDMELTNSIDLNAANRISILVDNRLTFQSLPLGELLEHNQMTKQLINYDFFNFSGIHRDVLLYTTPKKYLSDIRLKTSIEGNQANISYEVDTPNPITKIEILDPKGNLVICDTQPNGVLIIFHPLLWDINQGNLYIMKVFTTFDEYHLKFGIRSFEIINQELFLNHKKVYLKGFGKHEDIAIIGKGNNAAYNVRDFELMRWIGANSFRTSHYPYAEEIYDLADEYGILIIDEVPAVGFNFWSDRTVFHESVVNDTTLKNHKQQVKEMIERDRNHPSVVIYSLANEANSHEEGAYLYFKKLVDFTRNLTDTPLMIVEWVDASINKVASLFDIIGVNRYFGWYTDFADLEVIEKQLKESLIKYHERFHKPILLSEFGADTIAGIHTLPSLAFSEEFQIEFVEKYQKAIANLDFIVGEHVWNFSDFMTKPGLTRFIGNRKGIFTRDRQPKMIAHYLREHWKQ